MSWQATNWVIGHSKHKGSALLTLLCIANCANADGSHARPGMTRLAKDTRLSRRQVVRIVEKLEASGELGIRKTEGVENSYSLLLMNATSDKTSRVENIVTRDTIMSPTRDIATSPIPKDSQEKKERSPLPPTGYKQKSKPIEEKFLYPPESFTVDDDLKLWLAERLITFDDTQISELTDDWRRSRNSVNQARARTMENWRADWMKYIKTTWTNRMERQARQNGNGGNGKRYESAPERDARYLKESLAYLNNLSAGGGEDPPEIETRLLPANAGTGPATRRN